MPFGPRMPKRITKRQFDLWMRRLSNKLSQQKRWDVEKVFYAHLHEPGRNEGIDQHEFDLTMKWLRGNINKHRLSESDLDFMEESSAEYLKN